MHDALHPHSGEIRWRRLELARAAWGLTMLFAPNRFLSTVGTDSDRAMVTVGRILGARHVIQAVASGARPSPEALAMGVWVDAVHALCAAGLAVSSPSRTGAGVADAVGSLVWAAVGYHDLVTTDSLISGDTPRRDAMARWTMRRLPLGKPLAQRVTDERERRDDS